MIINDLIKTYFALTIRCSGPGMCGDLRPSEPIPGR